MSGFELLGADDPRLASSSALDDATAVVEGFAAPDEVQRRFRATMLDFAAAHPDALHRASTTGHFTGSSLVVDADAERVLVLFHAKLRRWLQPGGHADGDGNLAAVALREAREETGIEGLAVVVPPVDVDIHEVRPPREEPHLHLDVRYVVVAPPGAEPVGNHESRELRWVRSDELPGLGADEGLVRLAHAGLAVARELR